MASANGKWETVVSKKKGPVSRSDVKKAKQSFLDGSNNVKAEFKFSLEEDETIYEAAFKVNKENKSPNEKYPSFQKVDLKKKNEPAQQSSPKKSQQKQKKHHKALKPSPLEGIEEKISKISHEDLSFVINDVQERFPKHPLVWLKEVALWLHKQLPGQAEKDLMFTTKPKGFPVSSVHSEVKKELRQLLEKCSDHFIETALCFCITMMIDELRQGHMTTGLRIFVQLLIEYLPRILLAKMDEILNNKDSSQESYLIVIWTFSQHTSDLKSGLKIWWKVMFPVIRVSSHSLHVVNYIEQIITKHGKANMKSDNIIDAKKFYEILNLVFSSKSQLANSPSLQSRVDALYPSFKAMYLGDKSEAVNKDIFKKLLNMLNNADINMQAEVLRLLVLCLSKDSECFPAWLENIENTLKPSSLLWDYLLKNSDAVLQELNNGKKFKNKCILQEQANKFLVELRHIKRKGLESKSGFAECYEACNNFQHKEPTKQESGFSLWKVLKYLMIAVLAFVFIDIYTTKGYKGSRTEGIAVGLGINERVEMSLIQLEGVAGCVGRWSKENVPKYYATISPYVDPAIETTWEYTVKFSSTLYEYIKPGLTVICNQIEKLFETVDDYLPGYANSIFENTALLWNKAVPTFRYYTDSTIDLIVRNTPVVANQISTVLNSTCTWVYQLHPTFFDTVFHHTHCSFNCALRYIQELWQLVLDYAPVIMEASVEYIRFLFVSIQYYCTEGQIWLQNTLKSNTGGTNS